MRNSDTKIGKQDNGLNTINKIMAGDDDKAAEGPEEGVHGTVEEKQNETQQQNSGMKVDSSTEATAAVKTPHHASNGVKANTGTEEKPVDKHAQDRMEKKKRGRKPRSQRNRKRPRSELHSNDDLKIESTVARLEMNGKPILEPGGYEQFIRVIHPYPYTFSTYAKRRWIGRTLLDVYQSEFGSYPESYYDIAIRQGRILVCDKKVDPSYKIKESDVLTHTVHRHEPAVAVGSVASQSRAPTQSVPKPPSSLVKLVTETDDLIVIDKPGNLPIHPCGGYHRNCLIGLLEEEDKTKTQKFHTIHRLDRLTSGLVILAKSTAVAKHWSKCIRQRDCQKFYLARVRGEFPLNLDGRVDRVQSIPQDGEWPDVTGDKTGNPVDLAKAKNAHGYWITDSAGRLREDASLTDFANTENRDVEGWLEHLRGTDDTEIDCNESEAKTNDMLWLHLACPTRIAKPKNGICEAGLFQGLSDEEYLKTVKASETSFGVISYDAKSDSTLILCRPVTGRTHQIRLHTQYLGHSIANDPNYGGDMWYANEDGKEACAHARAILDASGSDGDDNGAQVTDKNISDVPATVEEVNKCSDVSQRTDEPLKEYIKRTCVWCARCADRSIVEHSMFEFLVRSPGIWLHAFQYCIEDDGTEGPKKRLSFRTELPPWATGF